MSGADLRGLPQRPPSEVEWEDLLLRVDIAPRALRVVVEDADVAAPALRAHLRVHLQEETRLQAHLAAMAEGTEAPADPAEPAGVEGEDATALTLRFVSLRARTFAMVQRRGLGVWGWTVRGGTWDGVTAYQLLLAAAARDGAAVAAARSAGKSR